MRGSNCNCKSWPEGLLVGKICLQGRLFAKSFFGRPYHLRYVCSTRNRVPNVAFQAQAAKREKPSARCGK